jgi:hypothetical protein
MESSSAPWSFSHLISFGSPWLIVDLLLWLTNNVGISVNNNSTCPTIKRGNLQLLHTFQNVKWMICTHFILTYKCLISLVQLSYSIITQNKRLFHSNVCKQIECKQTLYSLKTWLNYNIYISWMISPCIHSSVYEFESGYISPAFNQNSCGDVTFLLFLLQIAPLTTTMYHPCN